MLPLNDARLTQFPTCSWLHLCLPHVSRRNIRACRRERGEFLSIKLLRAGRLGAAAGPGPRGHVTRGVCYLGDCMENASHIWHFAA